MVVQKDSKSIHIRISNETLFFLKKQALEKGVSMNTIVNKLLEKYKNNVAQLNNIVV